MSKKDKGLKEEKPKEFCLLCGKHTKTSLKDTRTIQIRGQTLMIFMCEKCEVVVHNFLRIANQAIQAKKEEKEERRIVLPY
jgi:uncharacterized protein YlaI